LEVACRNARRLELKDFIKELEHLCLIAGAEDLTGTNFYCAIDSYKKSLENRLKDLNYDSEVEMKKDLRDCMKEMKAML